ncbi:MAG: HAMP domain-containing histidine kinase [Chloroflexi bacterium]|nr:HAMP domain-containing histidine kinase [Chloroflexota bacterium]
MNRLRTLRVRFALWTAGLLVAALALFGLIVYGDMARGLTAAVDDSLRLTAIELAAEIDVANGEPSLNEDPTQDPQYTRLREQNFSLRLWNLSGQLVQEFGPYNNLPPIPAGLRPVDGPGELTTLTDPASSDLIHIYTSPAVKANQVVGTLQVALNLKNVNRTLELLLTALFLGGPFIVIIAGVGGYFLAARALTSIDQITRTARAISANHLSARLNLPETNDEVGRLAATFDSMLNRLDGAFRRERQFTADASHELRTPLSAMETIIGSTLARRRTPAEYEQALIDLGQEAERMRILTEGLLQLAHQDAVQPPVRFERVDLSTLLKDVVESLCRAAEERGLKIIDQVPDGLTLMGDSDSLIRLFVNLLDNAIKYTRQGTITVAARLDGDARAVVTVCDTGVGIAPEHLPHVFDRFYRVDESRSSKDGMGLGLAIVHSIAHAHGGTVTVDSTPGQGSAFNVELPAR